MPKPFTNATVRLIYNYSSNKGKQFNIICCLHELYAWFPRWCIVGVIPPMKAFQV